MQGRRILIFLVVFLVTLPVVTAVADGIERSTEDGLIVRLGSIHDGERFVYDLHLTSEYRDLDVHIPGFFDIAIERIPAYESLDGSIHDVVATTVQTKGGPWDDGRRDDNVTQYLRVEDGVYVERLTSSESSSWQQPNGDEEPVIAHSRNTFRIGGDRNGGDLYARGIQPDSVFIHGNIVQQVIAGIATDAQGGTNTVGEWNGRTVYDIAESDTTFTETGRDFGCRTTHPEFQYNDYESREINENRELAVHSIYRTWVEPGLAFPVLNECHQTYHHGSTLVEEIHLTLELAHHEPGGEPIRVAWDRMNERDNHQPAGQLEAEPSNYAGAPPGGASLEVPLDRALDVVRASQDRLLRDWRDDGPVPFWLVDADLQPGFEQVYNETTESPVGPAPTPVPIFVPSVPPDPSAPWQGETTPGTHLERVSLLWNLRLANGVGEVREVYLRFNETESGAFAAGSITGIEIGDRQVALVEGRMPEALVPLDRLVDRFLADAAVRRADWLQERGDSVQIWNQVRERGEGAYDGFHMIAFRAKDPQSSAEGRRVAHDYDMRDAAPVREGHADAWTTPAGAEPEMRSYQPASSTHAQVNTDFPTAATASGLALALGFVAAFFWDAIARTFGQFVGAPLYAKIRKDKVLDHRTRDLIVTTVAENPGIAVEELRREVAVGYGTVCHHLDTLQRNGLVTSRKVGRRRCYFVPGAVDANAMAAVGVAGTKAATRLIEIVVAEPGLTQSEIAERLGVADSSVRYQAKRLLAHERLRAEREGRTVRYYPGEPAAA